jgi:hypothetical protein
MSEGWRTRESRRGLCSVRQRTCDQLLRMPTTRTHRPCKRLRVAEKTAGDVDVGDNIVPLGIFRTNDVDGRENRREHREEARVGDVAPRADAAAKTEACRAWITDVRIDLAVGSKVPLRFERVRLGVVLGIVQDGPEMRSPRRFRNNCGDGTHQTDPMTIEPFGMRYPLYSSS